MSGLTDGGEKVTMDTSRTVSETDFNTMWNSEDEPETTPPTSEPAVEARTGEEPAPDGGTNTAASPAPAPVTREDGATWSEKSQRWHKDGKIVAGEPPEPAASESSTPPNVVPVAELPAPEPAKAPESSTPPAPVVEPFAFRANGQRHVIEGLTVAPEKAELVRALLVDGMNHRQNFPKMQAEHKQRLAQAEAMVEAKSGKYNKASVYLFGLAEQLLAEQPEKLDMVRREVALMLREADLEIPKVQAQQPAEEVDLEPMARATLSSYLTELFEDLPGAKLLSDDDKKDLAEAFQARLNAYFTEHDGEIVLDTHAARKDFERELKIVQRAHQVREQATRDAEKLKAAASFNAATQTSVPPRPAARPKPALAAAPSGSKPKGFDQAFKDAWNAEDDE